jgi:hypothetical protein
MAGFWLGTNSYANFLGIVTVPFFLFLMVFVLMHQRLSIIHDFAFLSMIRNGSIAWNHLTRRASYAYELFKEPQSSKSKS